MRIVNGLLTAFVFTLTPAALAADPVLSLPVDCAMGEACFIQQYPDWDAGPGRADYQCRAQTYDGHDGTDIRLKDLRVMAEGVAVLAAAPGTVKGVRDGMRDAIVLDDARRARIKDRECGNGVVIDHGQGWETQYCHLRQGSVSVGQGQPVARGAQLGLVGSSGSSEFPHLEFIVRRNGRTVDPFVGRAVEGVCGRGRTPLWDSAAQLALPYERSTIVSVGFADGPLDSRAIEQGPPVPGPLAPALVAFGHVINTEKGDVLTITLEGPGGRMAENRSDPLPRPQARRILFTGKRLRAERWPAGRYEAVFQIQRNGQIVQQRKAVVNLP